MRNPRPAFGTLLSVRRGEDDQLDVEWRMRMSYSEIAAGTLPAPKELAELRAAENAAADKVERLKKNVVELRRRMQRLSGYERRMRGRLSALALAQSEEGKEVLRAQEAIRTEPLPEIDDK